MAKLRPLGSLATSLPIDQDLLGLVPGPTTRLFHGCFCFFCVLCLVLFVFGVCLRIVLTTGRGGPPIVSVVLYVVHKTSAQGYVVKTDGKEEEC